jgi:hypothetical protein
VYITSKEFFFVEICRVLCIYTLNKAIPPLWGPSS